jgi:hypothetical protein
MFENFRRIKFPNLLDVYRSALLIRLVVGLGVMRLDLSPGCPFPVPNDSFHIVFSAPFNIVFEHNPNFAVLKLPSSTKSE